MMREVKHGKHLLNGKHLSGISWRERLAEQFGFDVWKMPVCKTCEGYALWDQPVNGRLKAVCSKGHITYDPITVQEYYEKGYHVDRTGLGKDAPMIVERQLVKDTNTVYGGEIGLEDQNKIIIVGR
jgi:hypothetical protein